MYYLNILQYLNFAESISNIFLFSIIELVKNFF